MLSIKKNKVSKRTPPCVFIGYSSMHKGFICLDTNNNKVSTYDIVSLMKIASLLCKTRHTLVFNFTDNEALKIEKSLTSNQFDI